MKTLRILLLAFLACAIGSRATMAQPYSYPEYTMEGDTIWHTFPPPAGSYVDTLLVLKFRPGQLDYSQLCYDCDTIVPPPPAMHGGKDRIQTVDQDAFAKCKETLMTEHFGLDIVLDSTTRAVLQAHGVSYLRRMTAANPCVDTLSITRFGDTIPMDDYNWMIAVFDNDTSVDSTLVDLFTHYSNALSVAEPDYIGTYFLSTPCDPWFASEPQKSLNMIGMPSAWDKEVGDPQKTVAVVDNGIDYWRCDFGAAIGFGNKVIGGWNYFGYTDPCTGVHYGSSMPGIFTQAFHGTQVASIIGAYTDNSGCGPTAGLPNGMAGIGGGWGTVCGDPSRGTGLSILGYQIGYGSPDLAAGASAILEAVASSVHGHYGFGVDVVNASWGGPSSDGTVYTFSLAVRNAVSEAFLNGADFVAAKGNYSTPTPNFPSDIEPSSEVIAVGASDATNYGTGLPDRDFFSNWNIHTDLLAPGGAGTGGTEDVAYALQFDAGDCTAGPSGTPDVGNWFSGTSAATPHVSAVDGLLRGYLDDHVIQSYAKEDPEGMLKSSAADITNGPNNVDPTYGPVYTPGYDQYTGWGLLKADNLFNMLAPGPNHYTLLHLEVPSSTFKYGAWSSLYTNVIFYNANDKTNTPASNIYDVKYREVTGTVSYSGDGVNTSMPVYVWGNTYDKNSRGWANLMPNWEEPWCAVTDGDGDGNHLVPDLRHNSSSTVTVHTYQFDLWQPNGGAYVGRYPATPPAIDQLGMGITVFANIVPAGVNDKEQAASFKVWPSIASTQVLVSFDPSLRATSFDVIDDIGRAVMTRSLTPANQAFEIAVSGLPSGVYVCRLKTSEGIVDSKFVVQH